jgi:hypothetical protein
MQVALAVAARGVAMVVDAVAASTVAARGGASITNLLAALVVAARGGTLAALDGERRPWWSGGGTQAEKKRDERGETGSWER